MSYIDPIEVSPQDYKVLAENENVRILEMRLKVGESDNMHSHPTMAAYFVQGGKARSTGPDGEIQEMDIPTGAAMFMPAWTHRVENIGDTELHAIYFETFEN